MVKHSDISIERYHQLSDTTMDTLLESLENVIDEIGDPGYEVEYSSGVLTLSLGDKGTYVINKQPPNKQIWLSSPISGPKRYDYVPSKDGWYYSRDGQSIESLLDNELSDTLGKEVKVGVEHISDKVA
ncbi:Frataxin [Pyrrhoderma noxium]|uniref:ferroxidase n=1 Tax=Pyrrhoderma noxium TaxID=2282107 RepID=A0A286URS6_9AGAM|nr:Frataxin [Pyrrhoderma noxium]